VLDATRPGEGLAAYLLARHDIDQDDYDLAAARLDSALARKIDVPHVHVEALRLRIVVACARREADVAAKMLSEYGKDPDAAPSHVAAMKRLVDRCTSDR
jgi:predicted negative regulator of RcsB-dependent stress response